MSRNTLRRLAGRGQVRRSRRSAAVVGLLAVSALLLTACGGDAAGKASADLPQLKGVNGDPTNGPSGAPMGSIQIAEGWDKASGYSLKWDVAQSATAGLQLLANGSVQIAQGAAPNGYAAAHLDPKMRVIGFLNGPNYVVTVPENSSIRSAADLKGKTIGVMTLGSSSHLMVQGVVKAAGLSASDVKYLPVAIGAPMAQALNSGKLDALVGWEGMWQSISALTDVPLKRLDTTLSSKYGQMVLMTTSDVIKDRRDDLVAYMRNFYKSCALAAHDPQRAVEDHWKVFPNVLPPADKKDEMLKNLAAWNKDFYGTCTLPSPDTGKVGSLSDAELQDTYKFFLDNGIVENPVDLKTVVDTSITDDALKGVNLDEFASSL
ncbi:MAG TPA: ABC transporter substrate-binding protein [Actinomycetales bacterium]|nr:ABC transporter substrate-binding protein [Actinomycetales bacterium]